MDKNCGLTHGTKLPSGSTFFGRYDNFGMHDFGLYIFPNGTAYLGQFVNNRFHGEGTIKIPNRVSFHVLHNHGKLEKIQKMTFADELNIDFKLVEDTITFGDWKYCSAEDRRYRKEMLLPLAAVGPTKFLTNNGPKPLPLERDIFDLGYGKLSEFGHLTEMSDDILDSENIYVSCPEVRRWIREHCRHGPLVKYQLSDEVWARNEREIMKCNLGSRAKLPTRLEPAKTHKSCCEQSSYSDREVLQDLSSSYSFSSELGDAIDQNAERVCEPGQSLGLPKDESNVCRIN